MSKKEDKKKLLEEKKQKLEQRKKELEEKKKNAKEFSIEDLIAKKLRKDERKNKVIEVYSEEADRKLKVKMPSDKAVLKVINTIASTADEDGNVDIEAFTEAATPLIYNCCPKLHDKELQKACEIEGDCWDIVEEIFSWDERLKIAQEILNNSSVKPQRLDEDIKNL